MNHRQARESLGAYALGKLDPPERAAIEGHAEGCRRCQAELAQLVPVAGLLGRLSPREVANLDAPPDARRFLDGAWDRCRQLRRRQRWHERAWRLAALTAAIVTTVVLVAPGGDGETGGYDLRVVPAAIDAGAVAGRAEAYGRPWGTAVELDLRGLPRRPAYTLWAVATDGRRQAAATWAPTDAGVVRLQGACAIPADALDGYEVLAGDEVVLRLLAPGA